ncbi:Citrate lyase subunit beta [Geodia barretti]|uniref:Citrate lyase subunit beta n=1 Tax=Geodia barretti TaxID=519541 RepID=A0AA35T0T0_GEOBA|nr:Citrate lyase subunit beta [Geodia barretti]
MSILVRRSNLIIPAVQQRMIRWSWKHDADAITIDLQDGTPAGEIQQVRKTLRQSIALAGKAGAQVFVRVNAGYVYADCDAAIGPGLAGILLPGVESAAQVIEAAGTLTELERKYGVSHGLLEIAPAIETGAGIWHIREIITASPRIRQVGIDEAALAASLGIAQSAEYDAFVYARGRVCIEATAAGVQPVAVADPIGVSTGQISHEEMVKIATDSRNLGFKGMVCGHTSWVAAVNEAYTPAESLVDYYTQVREVFAQALAAGTAAAPFAGRMIDVPVDEWAKDVIAMSAACAARDAEKQAALASAEAWPDTSVPIVR